MSSGDDNRCFETVDWREIDRSPPLFTAERVTLAVGLLGVLALWLYDRYLVHVHLVSDWAIDRIDLVFLVTIVVIVAYGVVPAYRNRAATSAILGRLRSRPAVLLASGYLAVLTVVALVGPLISSGSNPSVYHFNPPVGFTSEVHAQCAGPTSGDPLDETCRGTLQYPLGTNRLGEGVEHLLIAGARPTLYVAVIGAVFVVPIATAVGVVAGLRGGLVDRLLMSYVDLQLSIPALVIYFIAYMSYGPSLLLLLVAFGLFSWGGIARLVRSEVIQRRENGHVTIARTLGASESYVARRHILPNITNTLVPAVAQLLALLVLYEAGVAFLGFHETSVQSWGSMISQSVTADIPGWYRERPEIPTYQIWWLSTFPAIALTLTMVSFKVIGDGLRDVLDPRGDQQ